jgi:hypothetical protein
MPLDVSTILRVSPQSIPTAGDTVGTTFEASAVGGPTRLRAEYRLDPPTPYRLDGTTVLEAAVSSDPQDFRQDLTLVLAGDASDVVGIRIVARVSEVGAPDEPAVESRGRVAVQLAPAAAVPPAAAAVPPPAVVPLAVAATPPAAGAAPPADLAGRLKALRDARGLTQEQLADELELSASTISRLERGRPVTDFVRQRLAAAGIVA